MVPKVGGVQPKNWFYNEMIIRRKTKGTHRGGLDVSTAHTSLLLAEFVNHSKSVD